MTQPKPGTDEFSGSKYLRKIIPATADGRVDVYAVLDAFNVTCPARQHAIKKLLCSGLRNKASEIQDLTESQDAVTRAIQIQKAKEDKPPLKMDIQDTPVVPIYRCARCTNPATNPNGLCDFCHAAKQPVPHEKRGLI